MAAVDDKVRHDQQDSTEEEVLDLVSMQLGVREIWMEKQLSTSILSKLSGLFKMGPVLKRLLSDVYKSDPTLVVSFVVFKLWAGIETAVLLHLSAGFLNTIGQKVKDPQAVPDSELILSLFLRIAFVALMGVVRWLTSEWEPVLEQKIISRFDLLIIDARLREDLLVSEEAAKDHISSRRVFWAFERIFDYFTNVTETVSQVVLILHSSRTEGGLFFAGVCMAQPLFETLTSKTLWDTPHFVLATHEAYLRKTALKKMSGEDYQSDVLGGNMKGYLLSEFAQANDKLQGVPLNDAWELYSRRSTPLFKLASQVLGDLPMVFFTFLALYKPDGLSVASIAVLQQSSSTLRGSIRSLLSDAKNFRQNIQHIVETYELLDSRPSQATPSQTKELVPYPNESDNSPDGMGFELHNVSFSYPSSKSSKKALDNVSLTIKPGSLVIVVGSNGSGKSTIVKLLSRAYDPTSGHIDVDGRPMADYFVGDLRRATAILSQDHKIFPVSMRENIGLGNVEKVDDEEIIMDSARRGGAEACLKKLEKGLDTNLDRLQDNYFVHYPSDRNHPLRKKWKQMWERGNLSGGEKQRIVAARTFMMFSGGRIRLCLVDEPTSAMDAAGELELFEELRKAREGKTMVFVTHRFGHLTKYADNIICMKDGRIEEMGKHEELMTNDGEYAKLYNIQAKAFSNDSEENSTKE